MINFPYKVPRNVKTIGLRNVGRDFENTFVYLGKTKKGRMKLGGISGSGPEGFTVYKHYLTKIEKKPDGKVVHRVYEGGSPLNTYYKEY